MDADIKHQQQQQQQHNHGHPARNEQNNMNSGYGYSEDDFDAFINPDTNASFNNAWDQAVVDPAIQGSGFGQQSQSWVQQPPQQQLHSNGYASAFNTSQNYQTYDNFASNPYPHLPSATFDTTLPFTNHNILQQPGYSSSSAPSFVNASSVLQGQTVTPSALQSFPNTFDRFSPASDHAGTTFQAEDQLLRNTVSARGDQYYDESASQFFACKIPTGTSRGLMITKDQAELVKATGSEKATAYLYARVDALPSDEPRVLFPRIAPRKSVKEVKRDALDYQSGRPWDASQHALLKKIRIKLAARKRGRPPKNASTTTPALSAVPSEVAEVESSSESSSEESDTDSATEDSEAEEPSPLPKDRPVDSTAALEYDAIKAVWSQRNTMLSGAVIKSALTEYIEIIKSVREMYKIASSSNDTGREIQTEALGSKVKLDEVREKIQRVLQAALKHGHPDIIERFGSSPILISILYTFLLDRFKAGDFNGSTSDSILKLLSSCTTLNQELLEKTKFDKMLPKLIRKGNEHIQELSQTVLDNAAKLSKSKTTGSKETDIKDVSKIAAPNPIGEPDTSVNSRRSRPSETVASQPVKRVQAAPPRTGPSSYSTKPGATSLAKTTSGKSITNSKSESKSGSGISSDSPTKPKAVVQSKTQGLLSNLKSASKKPGTSIDSLKPNPSSDIKASIKQDLTKPAPAFAPVQSALPKTTFSFSQALADLGKPKSVPEPKQSTKDRPPETDDEKRKRERKEARRKLRVTWKPAESLVDIRLFSHDPEEEQGHDRNMLRDVTDLKNEGRMLKLYSHRTNLEDEEEYEPEFDDDQLIAWQFPSEIDLSDADYNATMQNFTTRGGTIEVSSPEKEAQAQRERTTLIAIYPSLSDIPPSPREPADPYSGRSAKEIAFGQPSDETRVREAQFYSAQASRTSNPTQSSAPSSDIDAILRVLNAAQPTAQSQPLVGPTGQPYQGQPPSGSMPNNIESVFAQFSSGKPTSARGPAEPTLDPSIQAALKIFGTQQPSPLNYQAPPPQPAQASMTAPQTSPTPDISTLLSKLAGMQSNQSGDRKRAYEGDDNYNDSKRNKPGMYKYKTLPCKFWREGTCKKGDACTFLHE